MSTDTLHPSLVRQVVAIARELHGRLGSGWSPAIYREALALLLDEAGVATCPGREIGVAPCLENDLVAAAALVIRVMGVGRPRRSLAECLARTGLEEGLLLRFIDGGVESHLVHPDRGVVLDPGHRHALSPHSLTPMEERGAAA